MRGDRRRFLELFGCGALGLGATHLLGGCGSDGEGSGQPAASGVHAAGNVSSLTLGAPVLLDAAPIVVVLDEGGVYAMTTICTHQQCDIGADGSIGSSGLSCACHGSVFDVNGAVTRGPAQQPLVHYAVSIDASGAITVDADVVVSADVRSTVTGA